MHIYSVSKKINTSARISSIVFIIICSMTSFWFSWYRPLGTLAPNSKISCGSIYLYIRSGWLDKACLDVWRCKYLYSRYRLQNRIYAQRLWFIIHLLMTWLALPDRVIQCNAITRLSSITTLQHYDTATLWHWRCDTNQCHSLMTLWHYDTNSCIETKFHISVSVVTLDTFGISSLITMG